MKTMRDIIILFFVVFLLYHFFTKDSATESETQSPSTEKDAGVLVERYRETTVAVDDLKNSIEIIENRNKEILE